MIISAAGLISGCHSSSKIKDETQNNKSLGKWYSEHDWLNGLQLKPHKSINQQEFSRQYHLNKTWWDEAFEFLKTHDLDNLKPGNYIIDTGNVIASVSELPAKDKEQVNFEAHRNFNDLQYIIKGKAKMGIAPISDTQAIVTRPYSTRGDTETFEISGGEKYYMAQPGSFFIFSPKEIHKPAFKLDGYKIVKKIVIKVRVPENNKKPGLMAINNPGNTK